MPTPTHFSQNVVVSVKLWELRVAHRVISAVSTYPPSAREATLYSKQPVLYLIRYEQLARKLTNKNTTAL